jgi:hypothetical protein
MKENEVWRQTWPLVKELTKRRIGQMWVHHTGHDASRGYGDKSKEWGMDTVMHLDRVGDAARGAISFKLTFPKARERRPDNWSDFEDVTITLAGESAHKMAARSRSSRRKVCCCTCQAPSCYRQRT